MRDATQLTAMALGDSITQCRTASACYRHHLYRRLEESGVAARWVGSMTGLFNAQETGRNVSTGVLPAPGTGWPAAAQRHEGHWGWTASQLNKGHARQPQRGRLAIWLRRLKRSGELPGLVLLHIGTNDLSKHVIKQGASVNSVLRSVRSLLTSLCVANPTMSVLVASPIPFCRGGLQVLARRRVAEREYRERLHALAKRGLESCPRMRLAHVNMTRWVSCDQLSRDGVHPAAAGAQAMAIAWAGALRDAPGFGARVTPVRPGS
jgi:lysophospholipase L1-like esterase